MARSRRLTDGTRWRTFMRLLRLDDLMASYTNAGAPELASSVVDLDFSRETGFESRLRSQLLNDFKSATYGSWPLSSFMSPVCHEHDPSEQLPLSTRCRHEL